MKKRMGLILASIIMFVFLSSTMLAHASLFSGGFPNAKLAWKLTSISGGDTNAVNGVNEWNGISSKVKLTKTSTSTKQLDVLYRTVSPPVEGSLGQTHLFNGSADVIPTSQWTYAKCIVYNSPKFKSGTNATTYARATTSHEVGHALSMAHCQDLSGHEKLNHIIHQGLKNFTSISSYEKSELKRKWGN